MEIKIPREVRNYHETIFFGLSLRQFFCSAVSVAIAVFAYFALRDVLGNEGVSWVCIGDKYCRTLYMREFATFIKESMITEFTDLPKNLMLSIDMIPIPTDKAVKNDIILSNNLTLYFSY